MLHCASAPGPNREGAAPRAMTRGLARFASLSLAALLLAWGCSGPAGAGDGAALCPGGAGCADASAADDTGPGELPGAPATFLVASPNPLDFGVVRLGKTLRLSLDVANTGPAAVTITGFRLTGHLGFALNGLHPDEPVAWSAASAAGGVTFREPLRLAPAESSSLLTVAFRAVEAGDASAVLTLLTAATPGELSIPLHASVGATDAKPCQPGLPAEVDFQCLVTGDESSRELTISACDDAGSPDLVIHQIGLASLIGSRFTLDLGGLPRGDVAAMPSGSSQVAAGDPPVVIPAGTSATFRVTYAAGPALGSPVFGSWGHDADDIRLLTVGHSAPTSVSLRGAGYDPACPTPTAIAVKEGAFAAPGTQLHLRASSSFGCASAPPFYSWTVTQPADSTASFVPGPFSESPTFTLSHPGPHLFGLAVLDSAGHPQCAPAASTVQAGPGPDLFVELRWTTPGDEDPTDDGPGSSADLDLHFSHPDAQGFDIDRDGAPDGWFDEHYDCFWFNTDPNWGSPDPSADTGPHLKVDAPGGAQVESLAMSPVSDARQYKVGVHVWHDHGLGPSLATVRIYVGGVLASELADVPVARLDMWEVATIDWPGGAVKPILLQSGDRKILPDYDSDFFPVP